MKKIIFILFLIIVSFINSKTIYAFWVNFDEEKWFYTAISENVDKIEKQLYKIDIVWETWTKDKINKLSKNDCLKQNLSVEEINYVSTEWKIDLLYWKIDDKCKVSKDWITNKKLINLIKSIKSVDTEYKNQAKEKANQIFDMWSTWIYSDWIDWNSPFDLITDIKNIDAILFMWEPKEYEWNKFLNLEDSLNDLLWKSDKINSEWLEEKLIVSNTDNSNNEFKNLQEYNYSNSKELFSKYLCSIDNSDSWLNINSLYFLNSDEKVNNENKNNTTEIEKENVTKKEKEESAIDDPKSNYSKVNDNFQFPCESFFCIQIDFITYEHNLLWWFQETTIEYLIKRSNDHLKKFTNTSLVWSKMTTNNFELWLKDLNLPDIFHIWVQITKKPVPILKIEKNNKSDESIYKTENQLKFYYETYWLDYKRRNDLSLLKNVDTDKQIWLNSSLLSVPSYLEKNTDFNNYIKDKLSKKELMWKIISNETKIWIIDDFESQFKEIEVFNGSIKDYINNLDKIITNMLKKPEGS